MSPPGATRQTGIALVLVLWVVALMTTMALAMTATVRTDSQQVRNRLEEVRIRACSDAAVAMVELRLASSADEDHWWPDGSPHLWHFGGQNLEVRVYNELSRLDLNAASDDVLQRLFQAVGETPDASARIAAAVEDWRDRDDSARMLGAESGDYKADGRPYGSRNGPFSSVAELTQVIGVTRPLYQAVAPYLTVFGSGPRVDPEYADPFLRSVLQLDQAPAATPRGQAASGADAATEHHGLGGPLYRIRVMAAGGGPAVETLLRRGVGRDGVAQILARRLAWQDPVPQEAQ